MSRPELDDFQAGFAAALLASDPTARPQGLDGEASARFRVYRNNVHHGLGAQLAEAYPVVRRLVGEAFFLATAREYLAGHPPRARSLALFGESFADFLAGFPPVESLPYLPDVARLERARLEALHAADAEPLAPGELKQLGSALAGAGFYAHPATRIVESGFPIIDIWQANQPDVEPGPRRIASVAQCALITRPGMQVQVRALAPEQAPFARHLLAGASVPNALAEAGRSDESFDLMNAFYTLLVAGAFSSVCAEQHVFEPNHYWR